MTMEVEFSRSFLSRVLFFLAKDTLLPSSKSAIAATFFAPLVVLDRISFEFSEANDRLIQKFSGVRAVKRFVEPESDSQLSNFKPLLMAICGLEELRPELIDIQFSKSLSSDEQRELKSKSGSVYRSIVSEVFKEYSRLRRLINNDRPANSQNYLAAEKLRESLRSVEFIRDREKRLELRKSSASLSDTDLDFACKYVNRLQQNVATLYVTGVDSFLKSGDVRQQLEHSYVPLSVAAAAKKADRIGHTFGIPEILGALDRIIIRGPAGSGKTTILHWIISQSEFPKFAQHTSVPDDPQYYIPIFVPLRRFDYDTQHDSSLENIFFESLLSDEIRRSMPNGWFERACKSNVPCRLLLDGVDEVPEKHRKKFWEAVSAFLDRHPHVEVLITSRHVSSLHIADGTYRSLSKKGIGAITSIYSSWRPPVGFAEFVVQPLDNPDIESFIDTWYSGIDRSKLSEEESAKLKEYPAKLKEQAFSKDRSDLLELMRYPLLCALVCLIHFLMRGQLPTGIRDLYSTAIGVFIERRDAYRNVPTERRFENFDAKTRSALLRHIALCIQEGGVKGVHSDSTIEVDKKSVVLIVDDWKNGHPIEQIDSEDIVNFLIDRCSVIREPASSRIDFIHRSFMEYLAANEIALKRSPLSIRAFISDDRWIGTLRFCMDTEEGSSYFAGHLLHEMIGYAQEKGVKSRDLLLRISSLIGFTDGISDAWSEKIQELALAVVPPISESDVSDIQSIPAKFLKSALVYERVRTKSELVRKLSARVLASHEETSVKDIILSGYQSDSDIEVIGSLNRSKHISLLEHDALVKRIRNSSYLDTVFLNMDEELDEDLLNKLCFGKIGFIFHAEDYQYHVPSIFEMAWSIDLINASQADWYSLRHASGGQFSFRNCKKLSLFGCDSVDLGQLGDVFPSLEHLSVSDSNGVRFGELNSINTLKNLTLISVSGPDHLEISRKPKWLEKIEMLDCVMLTVSSQLQDSIEFHDF